MRTTSTTQRDVTPSYGDRRRWQLHLRPTEFDLRAHVVAQPGIAHSRTSSMSSVRDEHWFGATKTLDVDVAALRRKLSEVASAHQARVPEVVTIRGHGFRLELMDQGLVDSSCWVPVPVPAPRPLRPTEVLHRQPTAAGAR